MSEEHDVEENAKLMQPFLGHVLPNETPRFLCVFYDLDYHERLQAWARGSGFACAAVAILLGKDTQL